MYHTLEQLLLKNETRMDGGDLVKNVCDEFMRPNLNLERLFFVIQKKIEEHYILARFIPPTMLMLLF